LSSCLLLVDVMYIFLFTKMKTMSIVSVRIDERVKEVLKRSGINISSEVKRFLEELAWRVELKERLEMVNRSLERIPPAEPGFSVGSVRGDREGP
jgi:hypothetical protein